jgi:hypothetical protein
MVAGKIVGEFVSVVTWAHWAVQVALGLGGTQAVVVGLGLLVLTDTGQAKLTCNPTELPLACSWSPGSRVSSADLYDSSSELESLNTGESEA